MVFFKKRAKIGKNELSVDSRVGLIVANEPQNSVSEQFRFVRTNLQSAAVSKEEIKTFLVSSALPFEGKTTVATNLAVVYAQQGKKVLLVDADLRRPMLAEMFDLKRDSVGLTNYLEDNQKELVDVVQHTLVDNLDLLTSGSIPSNPAELLSSKRMTELLTQLKTAYDFVIFDVPPFLKVADAQVLMSQVDGVVMVVRESKTKKKVLQRAIEALKIADAPLLGFIYNDQNRTKKENFGYGFGYGDVQSK